MTLQLWGRWVTMPKENRFKKFVNALGQDVRPISDHVVRDFATRWLQGPQTNSTVLPSMSGDGHWVFPHSEKPYLARLVSSTYF